MSATPPPIVAYRTPQGYSPDLSVVREGSLLVTPPTVRLPAGCIRCGDVEAKLFTKKLYWHHPALFFLILFPGLLIYAIIALVVRKKGEVTFGLCDVHARKRRRGMTIALVAVFGLLALTIGGVVLAANRAIDEDLMPFIILLGVIGMLGSLIALGVVSALLKPKLIDQYVMKLSGAGEPYLRHVETLASAVPTAMEVPVAMPVR